MLRLSLLACLMAAIYLPSTSTQNSTELLIATEDSFFTVTASYRALAIFGAMNLIIGAICLMESEYLLKRRKRDSAKDEKMWESGRNEVKSLPEFRSLSFVEMFSCGLSLTCELDQRSGKEFKNEELIPYLFGYSTPLAIPDAESHQESADTKIQTCSQLFSVCPFSYQQIMAKFRSATAAFQATANVL